MGDIWLTSDTHFGHTNIIRYDGRPFASVEEHDEAIIDRWNAVVSPGDRVYHLGDFAFYTRRERVEETVRRLNGQIHLIFGNHDRQPVRKAEGFVTKRDYFELKVDLGGERKQKIVLFHYPLLTWNGSHHAGGSWMLHGHCHGTLQAPETTRLDVGTMEWDYAPVNLLTVAAVMAARSYTPIDQHDTQDRDRYRKAGVDAD